MTIIVDTSVWINFFSKGDTPKTRLLREYLRDDFTKIALTDLILCEILQGIKSSSQEKEVRRMLLSLPVFTTGGTKLAVAAAFNYRRLRKKGVTVRSTIDCLLATYALENDCYFMHQDKDFDPFQERFGLKVIK